MLRLKRLRMVLLESTILEGIVLDHSLKHRHDKPKVVVHHANTEQPDRCLILKSIVSVVHRVSIVYLMFKPLNSYVYSVNKEHAHYDQWHPETSWTWSCLCYPQIPSIPGPEAPPPSSESTCSVNPTGTSSFQFAKPISDKETQNLKKRAIPANTPKSTILLLLMCGRNGVEDRWTRVIGQLTCW